MMTTTSFPEDNAGRILFVATQLLVADLNNGKRELTNTDRGDFYVSVAARMLEKAEQNG